MSANESVIFLQIPDQSGRRVLRPGKWVAGDTNVRTARFEENDLAIEADQEAIIYYDLDGMFMRQAARINTVSKDQQSTTVSLQITGQPELAESRQCYRVSTVMQTMTATLDGEPNCPVLDVSATGIAAVATQPYDISQIITVDVRYEASSYVGRMHVATVHELSQERLRYGLLCVDNPKTNGDLIKGLTDINLAVQRLHLRRLSQTG